jgi:hypothetical protein
MEGPSSYELTGVRNIQLSHGSITPLPVILHPSISQARLLTPHLASLTYDYQMFVLRKGRDAENFPRLQNRTLQFLFGAQKPPANEAQATTSLNHGYTLGLSQSGPATAIRPCRLSGDADSPFLSACRVRDHRCLSPFLSTFSQIEGHQMNFVRLVCLQAADTRTLAHQHINNHGIHHNALDPSLVSSTICICWALEHCILPCCIVQICSAPLATVDYSRLPANIRMQYCYYGQKGSPFKTGLDFGAHDDIYLFLLISNLIDWR